MVTFTLTHPSWIIAKGNYDPDIPWEFAHNTGICWDGTNFFIVNTDTITVYKYNSDFSSQIANYDVGALGGNDNPLGIEWDGTDFFITDLDANVYKYPSDFNALTISYDLALLGGNANPYGICWDGSDFFIVDNTDDTVYKYPSDFAALTDSYDVGALGGNDNPRGICWDGTYFWVTDSDNHIYQYPSDFSSLIASYSLGMHSSNDEPWGIDYDGTYFFVIDYDDLLYMVYKYEYVPDVDITSSIDEFIIDHKIKDFPRARAKIFGQTLEYDDILLLTGNYNSYHNSKIDQNGEYYKQSLNFRDDTIGAVPADTSQGTWADSSGIACSAQIIDKYNQHSRVLQLYDGGAGAATMVFTITTGQTSGVIEFWMASTDPTFVNRCILSDQGAGVAGAVRMDADAWEYYDDTPGYNAMGGTAPVIGKWYRVTMTFDCDTDLYSITVVDEDGGAISSVVDAVMDSSPTTIKYIQFSTTAADSGYICFIGAIGFTWDTDYTLGDNANLETTLAAQTIFEGRVIKQNEEYIQDIELEALSVEVEELMPGEEGTPYAPDGYAHIANYSEEVIAETINDKCNNITATLTDEIYRGTLTCENDSDNAVPMGWIDASTGASTFLVKSDAAVGNHLNLIELADTDANKSLGYHYFEAQTSGTIEFWFYTTDGTDQTIFNLMNESAALATAFRVDADNFYYYEKPNGAAAWLDMGTGPTDATWYRIRIDFECGAGGYVDAGGNTLAADTASIYIYNTAGTEVDKGEGYTLGNVSTTIDYIYITTNDADLNYTSYFDGIGFSWDKHYTIGDNAHIYIEKVKVGAQTIDLQSDADHQTLQGELSFKRLWSGIGDLDTYIWDVTPDHKYIYSDGTEDSQIDLSSITEFYDIKGLDILERYNAVLVKAGWAAGPVRVYGSDGDTDAQATYGKKTVTRYYVFISDTTTAGTVATSILTLEGNAPVFIEGTYHPTTARYMQPGETVTVPASTFIYDKNNKYVPAGQYIVSGVKYDAVRDVQYLTLVSSLFYDYDWYLTQEMESLINQ